MTPRLCALLLALLPLAAGPPTKKTEEDPVHEELRAVRDAMLKAFDAGDIDALVEHVHPDVAVTWQNGETTQGVLGVKRFYEKMMVGDDRTVRTMTSKLNVDTLSLLYNEKNTAIAFGSLDQHFVLKDGMEFDLESRWTASLVRDKEKWKIVAFHVSTNMFNNGVLGVILRRTVLWTGIGVGLAALLVGLAGGLVWARRKPSPTP